MNRLFKILQFFRLVDENKQLSLTNIAVMVSIAKIIITPANDMKDIGLLIIPMLSYIHKRHINKK